VATYSSIEESGVAEVAGIAPTGLAGHDITDVQLVWLA
jgi:hypothetical protein